MNCDCSLLTIIMLKFVVFVGLLNLINAQYQHGNDYGVYVRAVEPNYEKSYEGEPLTRNFEEENHYEKATPYSFGYDVKDEHGNSQFHREESDEHGTKRGSYGYTDAYGIYRHVEYIADALGFRATIKTNEPGVSHQNPAHVHIHAEEPPASYQQNQAHAQIHAEEPHSSYQQNSISYQHPSSQQTYEQENYQ